MRKLLYIAGALIILLVAGYFIINTLIRQKVEQALKALPPDTKITYASLHPDILRGSLVFNDLRVLSTSAKDTAKLSVEQLTIHGLHFLALAKSHKNVTIGSVELRDIRAEKGKELSFEGSLTLDSLHIADLDKPSGELQFAAIRLQSKKIIYRIPDAFQLIHVSGLTLDSRRSSLHADTIKLIPTVGKLELGGIKGHQMDYMEAISRDLTIEGLDIMALVQHRLIADKINLGHNNIYVFRDRRLPLQTDKKPLPMDYLKTLPLSIRVRQISFGTSTFTYEEFPNKGAKTGILKIVRLTGTIKPLINHPTTGDPDYITMTTEGSLMGSGTVMATTKIPLHKGDPYKVEGAFHELDVTRLNGSAENLGGIHLESGILNSLAFNFDMNEEKATGSIIGEYHDLVVDKLRGKDDNKKVDKVKSFFLKKFIIPKNKDHSLAVSKRTGKVDYKHDPQRNFSYYLLHSLLVGVKSSFSLGFLLPG